MNSKRSGSKRGPQVYTVANAKGGVGKSLLAAELAVRLACTRRVLLLDVDGQGDAGHRVGVTAETAVAGVAADVLRRRMGVEEVAVASQVPGVDVVAASRAIDRVGDHDVRFDQLMKDLAALTRWDAVVIDTPPALAAPTLACLVAGDVIIAPTTTALPGIQQLVATAEVVEGPVSRIRPGQRVHHVVPSQHRKAAPISNEGVQLLEELWPGRVTVPIRYSDAVDEAYAAEQTVTAYKRRCVASQDLRAVLDQIIPN